MFKPTDKSRAKNARYTIQKNTTFEARQTETNRVLTKYPKRIPIYCEAVGAQSNTLELSKNKYLVPKDLVIGQFLAVVRQRVKLGAEHALFLFLENGSIPAPHQMLAELYEKNKNADGFLYISVTTEATFG